jgi:hypothetical protein
MALAHFGITVSQRQIARRLGYIPGAGIPTPNVVRLGQYGVQVRYAESGTLEDLERAIDRGSVVIAFVRTGELPYWEADVPHAIVVVAVEPDAVFLDDPTFEDAPIPIPVNDFTLAWDEFGNQWACISRFSDTLKQTWEKAV